MQPRRIAFATPRKSKMQLASRSLSLTTLVWGSTAAQSGNNHATLGLVSSLNYRHIALSHDHIKNAELSQTAYESPALNHLL